MGIIIFWISFKIHTTDFVLESSHTFALRICEKRSYLAEVLDIF